MLVQHEEDWSIENEASAMNTTSHKADEWRTQVDKKVQRSSASFWFRSFLLSPQVALYHPFSPPYTCQLNPLVCLHGPEDPNRAFILFVSTKLAVDWFCSIRFLLISQRHIAITVAISNQRITSKSFYLSNAVSPMEYPIHI